ncbi:hypothetical protein VNO80_08369 [Phaseolus coccineus]|uniref:Ubiquitin receptor RAD23 n=1 Tax=Phaseolus coccineus TaxID=3886 RepID=A0AAN9NKZ7_PHACN
MKINVKTLKGTQFVIQVNPQDTVADMKKIIEAAQGADLYPAPQQVLIHLGKVLENATTLEENKVVEDHFVVIMLSKNKVSSGGASTASSLPSNLGRDVFTSVEAAQPQSSFPPTPSTSRPPTPTSTVGHVYGHATSKLNTGSNLESTIQHILEIGGGNWDRDTVIRAIQAAFNNPERAIEYLYTGIPEQADGPEVARSPMARQVENSSIQAPQPAVPTSGPNTNPLNLFPQGIPEMGAITNVNAGDNSEQFQALLETGLGSPEALQAMLQDLEASNPRLLQAFQELPDDSLDLINKPLEDENVRSQLAPMMPEAVSFTPEENAAIQRLQDMGFDQDLVLDVFFACDKNEDLAANYLLDHQNEFED